MINNSFKFIGVALSDLILVKSSNGFEYYTIQIEVEKTQGRTIKPILRVMKTNKTIEFSALYKNNIIEISGYNDGYNDKDGNTIMYYVATEIYVFGSKNTNKNVNYGTSEEPRTPKNTNENVKIGEKVDRYNPEITQTNVNNNQEEYIINEDDLPF